MSFPCVLALCGLSGGPGVNALPPVLTRLIVQQSQTESRPGRVVTSAGNISPELIKPYKVSGYKMFVKQEGLLGSTQRAEASFIFGTTQTNVF